MRNIAVVVLSLGFVACATPYKPHSFWNDGGFSETEIQPGLFQVRFQGNEFSSEGRTADFAMLRASEICLSRGAKYMFLGDVATKVVQSGYIPGSATTTANASAYGYGNTAYASGTSYTTVTPPTALYSPHTGLTVACADEKGDGAWDAEFLGRSLRAKYKIGGQQLSNCRAADPLLTTWALTNALTTQHLSGSDTAAHGGDLPYRYGRFNTLSDVSFTPAAGILGAAGFGTSAQTLQSLASLQDASARLRAD